MVAVLTTLGIVIFFVGLLLSVAWHELGHYAFARMFNIRCTQFFVGFGKTLWSRKWGETEFGIKAVPLGGFVRMIGMIPPAPPEDNPSGKPMSRWRAIIEDAREANQVDLEPGDENRQFYQRKPWQRFLVMFAGPAMNVVLAAFLFAILLMGFGVVQYTNTVGEVNECVVPADAGVEECPADAAPTPAAEAGVRPGDEIVSVGGTPIGDWDAMQEAIRANVGPTTIEVRRDGEVVPLRVDLIENEVASRDAEGEVIYRTDADGNLVYDENGYRVPVTETAGFLGVGPAQERVRLSAGETAQQMGTAMVEVGRHLVLLPTRVPGLWDAAFLGADRDPESPVGVVGASRIGGEILSLDIPLVDRGAIMLGMLASVNLFLFALNMVPILPLDGGHLAGAVWESIRRFWVTKILRRTTDPGPFDVAKLMPVAYVVVAAFLGLSVLLLIADIVNPVRLVQ